jgi:hypothetical protein
MTAWIFQGNPDTFDMDAYLARGLNRISWTVTKHQAEIRSGDRVFLWRAPGRRPGTVSGVVALCTVLSDPWMGEDDSAGQDLWRGPQPSIEGWRVWLRVDELANSKGEVKREWLKDDPICKDLPIIKQPTGTNYPVPSHCLDRLLRLWDRTGEDWTRADCIAGLWAYDVTYQREVSKVAGSRVVDVALRIGRAVGGVYNKLMNFRALDPRVESDGFKAGGAATTAVWNEFYDATRRSLRSALLEKEFLDLWSASHPGTVATDPSVGHGDAPPPAATSSPLRALQTTFRTIRDSAITRWVKDVHRHTCQACGRRFDSPIGPVAEGAHIRPLGAEHEGPDDVRNVLCLCPTHHALFDRGAFSIADDLTLLSSHVEGLLERLATQPTHEVGREFLGYHRARVGQWTDAGRETGS